MEMKNHTMMKNPEGAAGFVLYAALLTILTAGMIGGFFLYSAYNHSQAARRWHDADQCLLDAQSALEQVKYEIIQAYGSNAQSSAAWFQNWSSNAIGATPRYYIPSPLTANGTPVFVTLSGVTVITNAGATLVNLTLAADARKNIPSLTRRMILEQMQMSISTGTGGAPIFAVSALGMYGTNDALSASGTVIIDGHNWNLPASFNSGEGTLNTASTNDLPGLTYDATGTPLTATGKISINGNPPASKAAGEYDAAYWDQFMRNIAPAAAVWAGGGDTIGTRAAPIIKIFQKGATTVASARSGAGIMIIPSGATVKFNQNFYYEGLVIVGASDANPNVSITINNTATIYGAMICLGNSGPMNISVPGTLKVFYSQQSLANLPNITNLPFASTGSNAVPYTYHWREIH